MSLPLVIVESVLVGTTKVLWLKEHQLT